MCKQEQDIEGSLFLDFCHTTQMVQTITAQHFTSSTPKSRTVVMVKLLMALFCCMTLHVPIVTHRMQDQLSAMQWNALPTSCILPGITALQFSHLWIITGRPYRPYTHIWWACTGGCRTGLGSRPRNYLQTWYAKLYTSKTESLW
jgi:hypothetical protein